MDDAPEGEEEREIRFVTFVRQVGDGPATNCPGDIPADDVTDWDQVTAWWGGGAYKAIAKDEKHRIVRYYPPGGSEWMVFEGDSLPFVRHTAAQRPGIRRAPAASAPSPVAAPAPGVAAPSERAGAPAPNALEQMVANLAKAVERLEARAAAPTPAPAQENGVVAAMIKASSDQAIAAAQASAETTRAMITMMSNRGNDSGSENKLGHLMLQVFKELRPAPAAPAQGFAEILPVMKAVKELQGPPGVPAPANDFQPLVDIVGSLMSHDAATKQAEMAARTKEPAKPPVEERPARREDGPLLSWPGVGVVRVLAPEAAFALPAAPIVVAPAPSVPVVPAAAQMPAAPLPPATAPLPLPVTSAEVPSRQEPPAPPAAGAARVGAAPAPEAPRAAISSTPAVPKPTPPIPPAPPSPEASTLARTPSREGPVTASATPPITEVMRQHAGAALFAISKRPEAERIAAITKLPGIGDLAYPVARAAGQINEGDLEAFIAGLEREGSAMIVELARLHLAAVDSAAMATPTPLVAPAPPSPEVSTPAPAPSEELRRAIPSATPPVTEVMRQHAGAALFAISQLPDAERVAVLAKLPGVGEMAYPIARAVGCLTEESVESFLDGVQHKAPELLVALAHRHTTTGTAGA